MQKTSLDQRVLRIAGVVVILALLVVGAVRMNVGGDATESAPAQGIRPVSMDDHRKGKMDAPLQMIVYTDLECVYCKQFHQETMPSLIESYGSDLVIVYRNFPLPSRPVAFPQAVAAECVYLAGGHDAYWRFVDLVFERTRSDNSFDVAKLSGYAKEVGLDESTFEACTKGGVAQSRVHADMFDGLAVQAAMTPTIVVRSKDRTVIVRGNYPARLRAAVTYVNTASSQ